MYTIFGRVYGAPPPLFNDTAGVTFETPRQLTWLLSRSSDRKATNPFQQTLDLPHYPEHLSGLVPICVQL